LADITFDREAQVKPLFKPFTGQSPVTRGYPLVAGNELKKTESAHYPFWFKWDTSAYASDPGGPRKLTFTATDWMDRSAPHVATFGPEFPDVVPPQSVPDDPEGVTFDVKVKAHLGPYPTGMTGAAEDKLKLSFKGQDAAGFAYEAKWKLAGGSAQPVREEPFRGTNATTPFVEKTLQVKVTRKIGVTPPEAPQTLVLRAESTLFPSLAHEIEVELAPDICGAPLTGTPRAAPSGFALIPGGSYQRGNVIGDSSVINAPVQTIAVSAFYIQTTETTHAQWDAVWTWGLSHGYTDLPTGTLAGRPSKGASHPVHSVSWYSVVKWCNARSEMEGLRPCYYKGPEKTTAQIYRTGSVNVANDGVCWGANGYRLPTEAEWEKAARGGLTGRRFPCGDTISHSQANYVSRSAPSYDASDTLGFHPSFSSGGYPYTSPVTSFPATGYGLHDMAGNVQEWCWDWFGSYATNADPRGPSAGSYRVLRGGDYNGYAFMATCAQRNRYGPHQYFDSWGFRPARGRP
jgi:hypothetical protein